MERERSLCHCYRHYRRDTRTRNISSAIEGVRIGDTATRIRLSAILSTIVAGHTRFLGDLLRCRLPRLDGFWLDWRTLSRRNRIVSRVAIATCDTFINRARVALIDLVAINRFDAFSNRKISAVVWGWFGIHVWSGVRCWLLYTCISAWLHNCRVGSNYVMGKENSEHQNYISNQDIQKRPPKGMEFKID